jgi:hypothetical protein
MDNKPLPTTDGWIALKTNSVIKVHYNGEATHVDFYTAPTGSETALSQRLIGSVDVEKEDTTARLEWKVPHSFLGYIWVIVYNGDVARTSDTNEFFIKAINETVYDESMESGTVNDGSIIWYADLNHDGIDDKIVVEIPEKSAFPDVNVSINIYDGDSGLIMFQAQAGMGHVEWDGYYLYYERDYAYLINWRPQMFQGDGNYVYEIFSFNDSGKKIIMNSGSYDFDSQKLYDDFDNIGEFIKYIREVNTYLTNSRLIVDTDGGDLLYGTPNGPMADPFVPERLFSRWV